MQRSLFLKGAALRGSAPQARTEIGEALPVADKASRFRESGTIGASQRVRES